MASRREGMGQVDYWELFMYHSSCLYCHYILLPSHSHRTLSLSAAMAFVESFTVTTGANLLEAAYHSSLLTE